MTKEILDSDFHDSNAGDLILFKKVSSKEKAKEYIEILSSNDIIFEVLDNPPTAVESLYGIQFQDEVIIKVRKLDFQKANELLNEIAIDSTKDIDPEHYLFKFSNEELIEILHKSDEWSAEDYVIARNILANRGYYYTDEQLKSIKQKRINDLAQPESGKVLWISIGYIVALLGGVFGAFIGWHLMSFKKTLPNGQKVLAYNTSSQKHGMIIFAISMLCLIIAVIVWLK